MCNTIQMCFAADKILLKCITVTTLLCQTWQIASLDCQRVI